MKEKIHRFTLDIPRDLFLKYHMKCVNDEVSRKGPIIEFIEEYTKDMDFECMFKVAKEFVPFEKILHFSVEDCNEKGMFKMPCPFGKECNKNTKKPFTVNPKKNVFYCFSCHVNGDQISFIARRDNISQLEALNKMFGIVKKEVEEQKSTL